MPYIDCANVRMYYEEQGEGDVLLLLAGLGCDSRVWAGVRDRLAKKYRVVMPDLRGSGRTDYDGCNFTMADMAGDIAQFLDGMGVGKAIVCGHSMGGQVALQLALDNPVVVSKLVMVCSDCWLGDDTCTLLRGWAETRDTDGDLDGWLRGVYRWMVTEGYFNSPLLDSAVKYGVNAEVLKTDADFLRQFLATAEFDVRERLDEINVPVLVIAGAQDRIFPLERQRAMCEALPNSRLAVLQDCAHSPLMESVGEFVKLLLDLSEN